GRVINRGSSRRKKSQGSNSGNGGNTRDESKMVGGAIGTYGGGIGSDSLSVSEAMFLGEAEE
nr:hypothetical protein [Tanacetum cinerariifolium]